MTQLRKSGGGGRTLAFFGAAWLAGHQRWIDGISRYLSHEPGLGFGDFRYLQQFPLHSKRPPPWTGSADGILVAFGLGADENAHEAAAWIRRGGVPAVSMVWDWQHPSVPVVTTDITAVMECAAEYLARQREVRHYLIISSQLVQAHRGLEESFTRRIKQGGHPTSEHRLSFSVEGAREDLDRIRQDERLIRLLRESPKPLAVFGINDATARAVCWLCRDLALAVPNDVRILGCGDSRRAIRNSPPISSVRTAAEQVGYEAAKLLHRLMDGAPPPPQPLLVPPEGVIERESTRSGPAVAGDVARALEFIRQHACQGIRVGDVVDRLNIPRRTLEQHFATQVGYSPGHEIQRIRLEETKSLLSGTDLPIGKVAELTGFAESSGLTNFFRKRTGLSPSQFRKQARTASGA